MNLPVIHKHYPDILQATRGDQPFEGDALFVKGANSPYIQPEDKESKLHSHFYELGDISDFLQPVGQLGRTGKPE